MNKKIDTKLIRKTITDWGKVLILLLDEAAVIVVILLILHFLGIQIPLPIIIVGGIIVGIFVLIIHIAVIPSFHRKQVTGREGMIGEQGRVVEPLTPVGAITVKGEYWRAKSIDDSIEADENVEIVGLEGLTLRVKRKGRQFKSSTIRRRMRCLM
ncbi:NfeD family protein [Chloroflexota bacterium]